MHADFISHLTLKSPPPFSWEKVDGKKTKKFLDKMGRLYYQIYYNIS
jgi:hypothetical protein